MKIVIGKFYIRFKELQMHIIHGLKPEICVHNQIFVVQQICHLSFVYQKHMQSQQIRSDIWIFGYLWKLEE